MQGSRDWANGRDIANQRDQHVLAVDAHERMNWQKDVRLQQALES